MTKLKTRVLFAALAAAFAFPVAAFADPDPPTLPTEGCDGNYPECDPNAPPAGPTKRVDKDQLGHTICILPGTECHV